MLNLFVRNLKVVPNELEARLEKLVEDNKNAEKRIKELENKIAASQMDSIISQAVETSFGKALIARVDGFNPEILKNTCEKFSSKLGSSVVALTSFDGEKNFYHC